MYGGIVELRALAEAPAQGQVAAGVLVYQGGIVHKPAHADGGVVLHQCGLAQIPGVLVGVYKRFKHLLALVCQNLNHLALLEPEAEVFYAFTTQQEGPGGIDYAVGAKFVGGGENFLGGYIGVEGDLPGGQVAVLVAKLGPGGKPYRQVCAVRSGIVELCKLQSVHSPAPLGVPSALLLPGFYNVVVLGNIAEL